MKGLNLALRNDLRHGTNVLHMVDASIVMRRCKCGAIIKVVTETDRAQIADVVPLTIVCPKCGDKQVVLAHSIVSIRVESTD